VLFCSNYLQVNAELIRLNVLSTILVCGHCSMLPVMMCLLGVSTLI